MFLLAKGSSPVPSPQPGRPRAFLREAPQFSFRRGTALRSYSVPTPGLSSLTYRPGSSEFFVLGPLSSAPTPLFPLFRFI